MLGGREQRGQMAMTLGQPNRRHENSTKLWHFLIIFTQLLHERFPDPRWKVEEEYSTINILFFPFLVLWKDGWSAGSRADFFLFFCYRLKYGTLLTLCGSSPPSASRMTDTQVERARERHTCFICISLH